MSRSVPWTPQEDAHLIVRYNAGWMAKNIGAEMGRSENGVEARLIRLRDKGAQILRYRKFRHSAPESPLVKGITQEDLDWMERYRQNAERRVGL